MDITCSVENAVVYARQGESQIGKISVPDIAFHWAEGVYLKMAGIAGVGTNEEFRGRGIAHRMMEEAKTFALEKGYTCSGISTNTGNIARRLYSRTGYTTLFRPGWFEKELRPARRFDSKGFQIRRYKPGDEETFIRIFEELHLPYFGLRKKTPQRWCALRKKIMQQDSDFITVVEEDGQIQGWAGYFRQWVGLISELWIKPSQKRDRIAQSLLTRLENHLFSQDIKKARFWVSPHDPFSADLLTRNGYRYAEQRVFMLAILHLPNLLTALVPLLNRRLNADPPWKGALKITTPVQQALLNVSETVTVETEGPHDVNLQMPQHALVKILTGVLSPREAYLEGLLSVEPGPSPEINALLERLFPEIPSFHPADDMW